MFGMFFFILGIDQNICRDKPRWTCRGIPWRWNSSVGRRLLERWLSQKTCDSVLVWTISSNKSSLRFVLFTNSDLVVSYPQIEFREYWGASKLIIKIVDSGKRIFVLNHRPINRSIILNQSIRSILLLNEERRGTRSGMNLDEWSPCEVICQFPP